MWKSLFTNLAARAIIILLAAALMTPFYNNTLAWNWNLPPLGFWEIVFGLWALRFCKSAIWNDIEKDP